MARYPLGTFGADAQTDRNVERVGVPLLPASPPDLEHVAARRDVRGQHCQKLIRAEGFDDLELDTSQLHSRCSPGAQVPAVDDQYLGVQVGERAADQDRAMAPITAIVPVIAVTRLLLATSLAFWSSCSCVAPRRHDPQASGRAQDRLEVSTLHIPPIARYPARPRPNVGPLKARDHSNSAVRRFSWRGPPSAKAVYVR